jgi:integrase
MARTVNDARLDSRTARSRLKAERRFWVSLDQGVHLGYRRGAQGGRWLLRRYLGAQNYEVEVLPGAADDHGDADGLTVLDFRQAQALARRLHSERAHQATGKAMPGRAFTVADAMAAYLDSLDRAGSKSAKDARGRAQSMILPKLGHIRVDRLTRDDIEKWMDGLAAALPRIRSPKGKVRHKQVDLANTDVRRSRRATANRHLATLKAALNHAWRDRKVTSNSAWGTAKNFKGVNSARLRYLTADEAMRLVRASEPAFARLVQAALASGCRFGELTRLRVADFNRESGTLFIGQSKSGKSRHVVLGGEGLRLFEGLVAGRTHDEVLLTRSNGKPWGRAMQADPMAAACAKAGLKGVSFHTLRHTWASLSVMSGMPLMVCARNLGHRDTTMVERHYGHLAPSFVTDSIRQHAPTFGFAASTVVPVRTKRRA